MTPTPTPTPTPHKAKPKKMRDGSWGLVTLGTKPAPGDTAEVTAANGKTWTCSIGKVIWTDPQTGDSICTEGHATQAGGGGGDDFIPF